jgi:hypothetical protein
VRQRRHSGGKLSQQAGDEICSRHPRLLLLRLRK